MSRRETENFKLKERLRDMEDHMKRSNVHKLKFQEERREKRKERKYSMR